MKTQLKKACPNPPAPPDIEDKKPQVQLIKKGHEVSGINLSAVLQSLHFEDIYDTAFDFTDEFHSFLSSSEEEGEIKDDEPAAVVMNEVCVKQEPVEPEVIQKKVGIGETLMDLNTRQEDPNKVDSVKDSKSQKHSRKHRKKTRKDESDSDESNSERYQKTQKGHKSTMNDSKSDDDSDDSVKFVLDLPKEMKIITEYLSSSDSDHSSNHSKEKKHHGTHKKQKEHFSDEDRYSKGDTYSCPLPPVKRKEDPKDETRVKKDKNKKEDSKTRRLEELLEKQVKKDKDKKVEEERNVKKEKMFKHERSLKEEKSIKEQKSIKEEKGFIKEDPDSREPVYHIHGSYSCETCHITMNSLEAYDKHMIGKRHQKTCQVKMTSLQAYHSHMVGKPHQKKLKLLNPHLVVANTITPSATDGKDKYPLPLPGVIRKQMKEEATIQKLLETSKNAKMPFPGLENVIEIHLLTEKKYYCKLCDSPCAPESIVPHLQGYKHRLKLLKFFRPDLAEKYAYKEKHAIDDKICKILHDIQKKRGIGKMSVEVDFRDDSASDSRYYDSQPSSSRDIRDMPSTSRQPDFGELYNRASVPNPDKPGFYCDVCHANANSEKGWQDHIRGKRHIKNLKKAPGELPSKCSSIPAPHLRPKLLYYISDQLPEDEPVVGLRFVQETQNPNLNMETYHCFLCGSFMTSLEIIDHVTSYKHRMKYLERIDHPTRQLLDSLRDDQAELVIQDMCRQEEKEFGRDEPTVHVTKGSGIYR